MVLLGASETGRVHEACNQIVIVGQAVEFPSPICHLLLSSQMHNTIGVNIFLCNVIFKE